jgi:hypothetical protein
MENEEAGTRGDQRKFQIPIGERIAYVEIISLQSNICVVEIAGQEPIFITKIRDQNNQPCWVSMPQGNDDLATAVGKYLDEQFSLNKK